MKKIFFLNLMISMILFSCQNDNKSTKSIEKPAKPEVQTPRSWVLNTDKSSIHWTGFKTTDKIPVKGEFKNFEIKNIQSSENMPDAIKNAEVSINIFSIFSGNESRDKKLIEYLFQHMMETNKIDVKVTEIDTKNSVVKAKIRMNNHEMEVPLKMTVDEQKGQLSLDGKIDLVKDFDAAKPLSFLNTACFDLHKGKDGISKTWPDVAIKAVLKFEKK